MKTYRRLINQDLSQIQIQILEQARDELTQDISLDAVHPIEQQDMYTLASNIITELERRKGGREAYQNERRSTMPQPAGNPVIAAQYGNNTQEHLISNEPRKKKKLSFSTVVLILTLILLVCIVVFLA